MTGGGAEHGGGSSQLDMSVVYDGWTEGDNMMKTLAVMVVLMVGCAEEEEPMVPMPDVFGSICAGPEWCESEFCLKFFLDGSRIPDGMCTLPCVWDPKSDDDTCQVEGDGLDCIEYVYTGESYCMVTCEVDADCVRRKWYCEPSTKTCVPTLVEEDLDLSRASESGLWRRLR